MEMTKRFQTSDIALASYLFALGSKLLDVDHSNPHRVVFHFELNSNHKDAMQSWQECTAMVNALAFYNSYQTLKRKIFNPNA